MIWRPYVSMLLASAQNNVRCIASISLTLIAYNRKDEAHAHAPEHRVASIVSTLNAQTFVVVVVLPSFRLCFFFLFFSEEHRNTRNRRREKIGYIKMRFAMEMALFYLF